MKVVVTLPAYNEEKTLGRVLQDIKKVMSETSYDCRLLVADDGSTDKTPVAAKNEKAILVSHQANLGLAETFKTEMAECLKLNPDVIVHIDADGQYLAKEIPKLVKEVERGYDLVLGSRFMGTMEQMPFLKRIGNRAFSRVISGIVGIRITDAQTGFRALKPQVARMKLTSTHTYTQEQIIRAVRGRFRIKEVPVYFAKRSGKSKLMKHPLEYAVRAWVNLLRVYRDYEPLKFFGIFGSLFLSLGVLLGIWIVITFLQTGGVGGIPRVMLSALFIMTGVQIMLFGFLADMKRE
jgi:glycosyltransferase involved in cell wall biosynthesis